MAKFTLLYVGTDEDLINKFEAFENFVLIQRENGFLAVNYLENNEAPDLIFSENVLKGMNGFSLRKEIFNKLAWQAIPFFLIDETFTPEEKSRALQQKIDEIFFRPVDPNKVYTRLKFVKKYKEYRNIQTYLEGKRMDIKTPIWKRAFDILIATILLLLLSPLFIAIIIAQQLESYGPVFYSGKRVGAGYNIFPFHKFRSMYVGADKKLKELSQQMNQYVEEGDAEEDTGPVYDCPRCKEAPTGNCSAMLKDAQGRDICEYQYNVWKKKKEGATFVKIKNDPRVTKVGRFIRKTSIDELPQLFNVLKGEMSIVGNRPIPLYEAEMLTNDKFIERFNAPAGITGLWQVSKRGKGDMSEEERKMLDNEYASNITLWQDLKILVKTPFALIAEEDV